MTSFNTVETLKQEYLFIPAAVKDCYLTYLIRMNQPEEEVEQSNTDEESSNPSKMISIIVFTAHCRLEPHFLQTFVYLFLGRHRYSSKCYVNSESRRCRCTVLYHNTSAQDHWNPFDLDMQRYSLLQTWLAG